MFGKKSLRVVQQNKQKPPINHSKNFIYSFVFRPLFKNASRKINWWHIHQGRYCAAAIIVPLVVLQRHGCRAESVSVAGVFFFFILNIILTFTLFCTVDEYSTNRAVIGDWRT